MRGTSQEDTDHLSEAVHQIEQDISDTLAERDHDVPDALLDRMIDTLTTLSGVTGLHPAVTERVWAALGFALKTRYMRGLRSTPGTDDIDRSIAVYRSVLSRQPPPGDYAVLANLAQAHLGRQVKRPHDAANARDTMLLHAHTLDAAPDDAQLLTAVQNTGVLLRLPILQDPGIPDLGLAVLAAALGRARDRAEPGSETERWAAHAHAETLSVARR
ncbi:hypothetical protein GCM10010168_63190 [Actinoplanes ianthinogenes]|uniref:Uncharacterized protein n=1 Tax=Actinoplanes ianthinogenes TaxID=122358 RepID=A0ABN6C2U5_9ACTN|nr:hypothetical protein [Actinoplanes ianthinogenes]BCJ39433.1 hypothetical protein Aiant_00900 [Actinoplanes ianthinogenes]GGR36138.1 hypothetical protein GCM10010168_63190 [Actinoplanes ianthinogenes]